MPHPGLNPEEERKSYSAVFLLAVGLLLAGAVWAIWDDNISRRPWKKYQAEFYSMEIARVRDAIAKEDARLAHDPEYRKVSRALAAARARLDSGETAERLRALEAERKRAKVRVDDQELALRIVKSRLEEAWYAHERAVLTGGSTAETKARIEALQREKARVERRLARAKAELQRIEAAIQETRSEVTRLSEALRKFTKTKAALEQKLDNLLIHLGPVTLPKIPKIQQVALNGFDRNNFDEMVARVDRCHSCHIGIDKAGFEQAPEPYRTHPRRKLLLGHHPVDRFGCTPCHDGQGPAVNSVAAAHGEVEFWEYPLRHGALVQASCIGCHDDVRIPGAETIARGERLFEQLGCHGCHLAEGYGQLDKIGPYLRRVAAKVDPGWLVRWIENPHRFRPRTRMPNFMLDRDQAVAIAAYLLDASRQDADAWLAAHPEPTGIDPGDPELVARGRALVGSLGCWGCHGFAPGESPALLGENKDIAPNLSRVAEKTTARWIYHWLKNPRGYSPVSRMPSLRLSDDEARAITAYLATLGRPKPLDPASAAALGRPETIRRGEALVRRYGCFGCHDIPGMEKESRIGVELTTFGDKPLEQLFFGNHTDIPHTWYDWTYNKLKRPRTYATDRIEQIMPQFDLADADIRALIVFLASRTDRKPPARYHYPDRERERALVEGRRVVEKYNCIGCHVIEGRGGAIRARYEDNPNLAPPILNGEGAKVQADWLFGFIKRPVPLRPWLKVRMPTFGLSDAEADKIVEYFLAQERIEVPFVYVDPAALDPVSVAAGRKLASPDYFNCFSCHQQGEKKPEGPMEGWAPDLALAAERLNPGWILRWLKNPQALQPGTKMPQFYDFENNEPDGPLDIFNGDEERQVEALRDFVLSLHYTQRPRGPELRAAAAANAGALTAPAREAREGG